MCRILAYLGEPLPIQNLLFDTDNSLVRQSYSPRMMNTFLNLAGFGMQAWDPTSLRPEDPFTYRATTLPPFDRNLRYLASKLAPTCLVAHVRGVTYSSEAVVTETNLHPFHFDGQPLCQHRPGRGRHPLLLRLRLVPARGRDARDRPPVRESLVRDWGRVHPVRRRLADDGRRSTPLGDHRVRAAHDRPLELA